MTSKIELLDALRLARIAQQHADDVMLRAARAYIAAPDDPVDLNEDLRVKIIADIAATNAAVAAREIAHNAEIAATDAAMFATKCATLAVKANTAAYDTAIAVRDARRACVNKT